MRRAAWWLSGAMAVAAGAACGGGELEGGSNASGPSGTAGTSVGSSGSSGASGKGAAGAAGAAGATSAGGSSTAGAGGSAGAAGGGGKGGDPGAWLACQDSDQAWVRKAIPAVTGRRALGQAEVSAYVDLIAGIDTLDGVSTMGPPPKPGVLKHSRSVALSAMRQRLDDSGGSEYVTHFTDVVRDALRVQRLDDANEGGQANVGCYGVSKRPTIDPALAATLRDGAPDSMGDGNGAFTMLDAITSSIALDDLSPAYVANIMAMLQLSYQGANADELKLELARRSDFGAWFDAVYLHRDGVCLKCHNSQASATFDPDPTKNRFFPLPGHLEAALFDSSFGNLPKTLDGIADAPEYDGVSRAHAVLRFTDFAESMAATQRPWAWDKACGTVVPRAKIVADFANVDAKFGTMTGNKVSGWDVTDSLQRGFAKLRATGLQRDPDGTVQDADQAFAYLVSVNIAEGVWREVVGTPLTIANYFPRNAASSDQLGVITDGFVASGFSLQKLLELITGSAAFNVLAPDAGCGGAPYPMPALYDPWVIAEEDPARRGNSLGDGVAPISTRTLLRTTYRALGWPNQPSSFFPHSTTESQFQGEVGVFMKNAEAGFRGFDFQARLSWEDRFGICAKPADLTKPDFVEQLLAASTGAKTRDVVAALKDRLFGDARIDDATEKPALEALMGVSLDADAATLDDASLRRACGALLSSPQFLLGGLVPKDTTSVPMLSQKVAGYGTMCQAIAAASLPDGLSVTCTGDKLAVSKLETTPRGGRWLPRVSADSRRLFRRNDSNESSRFRRPCVARSDPRCPRRRLRWKRAAAVRASAPAVRARRRRAAAAAARGRRPAAPAAPAAHAGARIRRGKLGRRARQGADDRAQGTGA